MIFTLNYDIAKEPFWHRYQTSTVQKLLEHFYHIKAVIQKNYEKEENCNFFQGYDRLHYLFYLRETLVGENTVHVSTTLEDVERLLEDSSKLGLKTQNLHRTIIKLFPNVFVAKSNIDLFTSEFLKDIHSNIGHEIIPNAGLYRVHYAYPSQEDWLYLCPEKISITLDQLCQYVRDEVKKREVNDLETLVKISATFLTNFLQIHPFSNGNGRVVRLAVSWLLAEMTVVPVPLYLNVKSRETYLQCLRNSRTIDNPIFIPDELARFILESVVNMNHNIIFCLDLM